MTPSFIHPAPSLRETLSSSSGLGGRYCSEDPGHGVLAGWRALRENRQEPAGWRGATVGWPAGFWLGVGGSLGDGAGQEMWGKGELCFG